MAVRAEFLFCVYSCDADTTKDVDPICRWLQMVWIDAKLISTEMIYDFGIAWSSVKFIHQTVRLNQIGITFVSAGANTAITTAHC